MIAAIVLAAGMSSRMGQAKLVLPWGSRTVIGQVVHVLLEARVDSVVVVTGASHDQVERALKNQPVRLAINPRYMEDQMALSLQTGLSRLSDEMEAVMIVLGDQPQIEASVVQAVIKEYQTSHARLVVPSYQMRRGHPWIVDRSLWPELMVLQPPATLRDFLTENAGLIHYLIVDNSSILLDLDTPEDYARQSPPPA